MASTTISSRDSSDVSQTGVNIPVFLPSCKTDARCGLLPVPRAARAVV